MSLPLILPELSRSPTLISILNVQIRFHGTMKLPGVRISIRSDCEELKECTIEVSANGKKAACWVSGQSGKIGHTLTHAEVYKTGNS